MTTSLPIRDPAVLADADTHTVGSSLVFPHFPPVWAEGFGEDRRGLFAEFRVGAVRFVWRWIPPGEFLMGSPKDDPSDFSEERPQHSVRVSRGFWMGETLVTQEQWSAVMKTDQSQFKGPLLPVETVDWHAANDFTLELNGLIVGLNSGLPSEAQWEYACRAGTQGAFHLDGSRCPKSDGLDPVLDELGWFGYNSGLSTQVVGRKKPNAWGLYDMHGNVWEWCRDVWDPEAYGKRVRRKGVVVDPVNEHDGEKAHRVIRGGAWNYPARMCRAAYRFGYESDFGGGDQGFRLCALQI